jgi:transposase-like protein
MAPRSGGNQRKERGRGSPRPYRISSEEIAQFRELHAQGLTCIQIARFTGWGKSAVCRHIYQADRFGGRTHRRWTDDDNQALVDCYAESGDKKALAARLGRSVKAVYIAMCRYRKAVRKDPKKRRTLGVMTFVLKAIRKADIYKELEE